MRKTKNFISALILTALSMSIASCGSSSSSSSSSNPYADVDVNSEVRNELNQAASNSDLLEDVELENKTIKWMANWDINPDASGKNKPPELVVFEEKYGGKIEWIQCDWASRYEKLAETINSGEGVDFFYAGDGDAFPKGAVKGMFTPVDDYIDFSTPLWEDVQELNDSLIWNGHHYCTVVQPVGDKVACIYNRKTVEEAGLDDPAELYAAGRMGLECFSGYAYKLCRYRKTTLRH